MAHLTTVAVVALLPALHYSLQDIVRIREDAAGISREPAYGKQAYLDRQEKGIGLVVVAVVLMKLLSDGA